LKLWCAQRKCPHARKYERQYRWECWFGFKLSCR